MSKKIRICKPRGLFAVIVFRHINILNANILSQDMVPKVDNSCKQKAEFLRVSPSIIIIVSLLFMKMSTIVAFKKFNYIRPSSDRSRISLTNCATSVARSS